jgi:two-component system KDP operon response regulator KdpE
MSIPTRIKAQKARIFVVTDEPQIEKLLKSILTASGYRVFFVSEAAAAIPTHIPLHPELLILDLGLSDLSGHATIPAIRRCSDVPMIVLSGQHREADLVAALDLGADDYLEKPVRTSELLARMRSLLRRSLKAHGETANYHCGALDIDILDHRVTRDGEPIRLTPTEFEILALLVRSSGRVVPYQRFFESPSDVRHCRNKQALRSYIWGLRQKIEQTPENPRIVLTEEGIGYRIANDPAFMIAR